MKRERRRFGGLFRGAAEIRAEVDDEIRFHLEMRAAELERAGWTPAAAREEALRRFGDVARARAACVEADTRKETAMQRREHLREAAQDLAHGARLLARRPAFALTAVLTLAVGIGAATAVFSAADHVLLRPLPYRAPDRVVTVWETDRARGEDHKGVSPGNFRDWRERTRAFQALALAEPSGFDLTGEGPPESVAGWSVSEGFFEALGVTPLAGRAFTAQEYAPNGPAVVMVSHALWRRRFGEDPAIVGRRIRLDGSPVTVVGVLPPTLEYPEPKDLWAPKRWAPGADDSRRSSYMFAVGRLRPGVSAGEAQADLARVAAALSAEHPRTNHDAGVRVVPLEAQVLGPVRPALLVLLAAVGFVLLIACANVASLLLARGAERERELAVRAALGAGRGRLLRQLAAESVLLVVLGGAAGVVLAYWGVRAIVALSPAGLPRAAEITVDARVLAFAAGATVLAALLAGLAPALRFSRPDVAPALQGGGRTQTAGPGRARLRGALVAAEVALAVVLLIGAGLLGRSFAALLSNDLGFEPAGRATLQLFLWDRNPTDEARVRRTEELVERFRALSGVEDAAAVSALPFHPTQITTRRELEVEGRAPPPPGAEERVHASLVTPAYFRVMGMPLRAGRPFAAADRAGAPPVAVVNESLARRFFPGESPVGRRVRARAAEGEPMLLEIVGVVGDVRPSTLDSDPRPELYVPHAQHGSGSLTFVARTRGRPERALRALEREVWAADPEQTVYHSATLESLVGETLAERRFHLALLGSFSAIALVLAVIGVYGLVSVSTAQRSGEIGIRMALGARAAQIVRMVVGQGVRLALPGVVLGVAGALLLTRFLRPMLYRVPPTDPATFVQLAALMLLVAAAAAFVPARRASAVDPMVALRRE